MTYRCRTCCNARRAEHAKRKPELRAAKQRRYQATDKGRNTDRRKYRRSVEKHGAPRIYVVSHPAWPNFVKIGRTGINPQARLSSFNTGCPFGQYEYAALVEVYDATIAEAQLHRALTPRRVNGEWFRVDRRLAIALAEHLGKRPDAS